MLDFSVKNLCHRHMTQLPAHSGCLSKTSPAALPAVHRALHAHDRWLVPRRCKASFILHGTIECYFVFDRTSYRTGLDQLKNTAPYPGVSLNFCALQLDDGPIKTSTICFDNSGIDPNHPYVIAKVDASSGSPALCRHARICPENSQRGRGAADRLPMQNSAGP